MTAFSCRVCEKEFARPWNTRKAVTCSLACKHKWVSISRTGVPLNSRRGGNIACKTCGQDFYEHPGNLSTSKYCSLNCRNADSSFFDRFRGKNHPSWKGGRTKIGNYVYVKSPDHPNKNSGGYVAEHRLVMEKALGRLLTANEEVHHRNGIKTDNAITNLEVVVKKMHFGSVICPHCQNVVKVK
jgi:hypothetical protein